MWLLSGFGIKKTSNELKIDTAQLAEQKSMTISSVFETTKHENFRWFFHVGHQLRCCPYIGGNAENDHVSQWKWKRNVGSWLRTLPSLSNLYLHFSTSAMFHPFTNHESERERTVRFFQRKSNCSWNEALFCRQLVWNRCGKRWHI